MARLKSAFEAAYERYFKDALKQREVKDIVANAAITETQFYARQRLAKNLIESAKARTSSRFGHNGVIKGTPSFIMLGVGEMFSRNSAAERQAVRINREIRAASAGIAPLNFYPPAVIQKPVSFLPRYRFDYVGNRQKFIKVAATEETGLAIYDPIFAQEQKERYGLNKRGPSRISLDSSDVKIAMGLRSAKFAYGRKIKDRDEKYNRLMMDDFEGSVYDLMKDGLSRKQAEDVYVRQNAKWLSVLAKNNPKIAKHVPQIAKTLGAVSKIPGLGMAVSHPGLAALTMLGFGVNNVNRAKEQVAEWQIQSAYTGSPSGKLLNNLYKTGLDRSSAIKQYGTIASWIASLGTNQDAWKVISDVQMVTRGKLDLAGIYERSSVEDLGRKIAEQMPNLSREDRMRALSVLSRVGINSNVLKGLEYTYGSGTPTAEQDWIGRRRQAKDWAKEKLASRWWSPITWIAQGYRAPILGDLMSFVDEMTENLPDTIGGLMIPEAVERAARSAEVYDAKSSPSNSDNSKTVTWNVNIEKVEASNVDEMIAEIKRRGSMSSNSYAMIIEDNDNREIA